tara:strand:- start:2409 stop:2633 length:225 start_codon:yes stop_codon:yes gene_type:complete
MANELLKLGGLWKNTDKNGNEYFSGNYTYGTKLLIYINTFKERDNEPDYILYITKQEKKNSSDSDTPKTDNPPF